MIAGGHSLLHPGSATVPPVERTVRVRMLGGFEVDAGDGTLTRSDWQRVAAERLVKLLLVAPGRRLSREAAAEMLWPEAGTDASRGNFRKALHFAGQALRGSGALAATDVWVALNPDRLDVDLDRLGDALDTLTSAAPSDGDFDRALEVALRLGGLELLPDDLYEDWLVAPRERLRDQWQRAALQAGRRAQATGHPDAALEIAERLLERDPTDEAAHRLAIEVYAAQGRHHAARWQFDTCCRALRDDLDAEPSAETVEAFRTAARSGPAEPGGSTRSPRLVARRQELERIEPLLDRVLGGKLAALVVHGPAGIGKSRLLDETVAFARASGWQVLRWRAIESGMALPYGPVAISLAELLAPAAADHWSEPARSSIATLLPALGLEPRLAFADRSAFVAGLVGAFGHLARAQPLLVAVDDLPWLDAASAELLGAILAGLEDTPILVAATLRDEETPSPTTMALLEEARRASGLDLPLGPLAQRDLEPLVIGHLGGETVSPGLIRTVFERSLGNPLFSLELVRAARDRSAISLVDGRWAMTSGDLPVEIPTTVQLLVTRRTASLPDASRELLAVAAELGPVAAFDTLAAACATGVRELLHQLDEAIAAGLLVESAGGYSFAHPLYRLAVLGALGRRRRGEARWAIARALAGIDDDAGRDHVTRAVAACPDPVAVAEHALAACDLGIRAARPLAIASGFLAGERARRLFERADATALLERSLTVWRGLPASEAGEFEASAALLGLADLRMATGDDDGAARAFREAITTSRTPDELARAYAACSWLPYRHGDFEGALEVLEEGLTSIPDGAFIARARIQTMVGWCLVRMRRMDDALAPLAAALAAFEADGDRAGAMQALDFMGILLRNVGRPDEGLRCLEQSLAHACAIDDAHGEMLAHIHIAVGLGRSGRPAQASPHLDRSLELARLAGDRYAEAVCAWSAAEIEDRLGNHPDAVELRRQELRLLASIGGNPVNEALAHAHLAYLARLQHEDGEADREAAIARQLADSTHDPAYVQHISTALATTSWSSLES